MGFLCGYFAGSIYKVSAYFSADGSYPWYLLSAVVLQAAADWTAIVMFIEFFMMAGTLVGILTYKTWAKVRHS